MQGQYFSKDPLNFPNVNQTSACVPLNAIAIKDKIILIAVWMLFCVVFIQFCFLLCDFLFYWIPSALLISSFDFHPHVYLLPLFLSCQPVSSLRPLASCSRVLRYLINLLGVPCFHLVVVRLLMLSCHRVVIVSSVFRGFFSVTLYRGFCT